MMFFSSLDIKDQTVPILFFANKADLDYAHPIEKISESLDLEKLPLSHQWHIQKCDAISGKGVEEGIKWLSDKILKRARK